MAHLYIPGVAEYAMCKKKFKLAESLLEEPAEHRKELSDILQTLNTNPDAVRFLEEEFGQKYKEIYSRLAKISPFSGLELIDDSPADNGNKKTQNDWFDWWDRITDDRIMASMSNLYQTFKLLKKMSKEGSNGDVVLSQKYLDSLRNDFDWPGKKNWLVSSTRVNYSGNNSLDGEIIQHYRCKKAELMKKTNLVIPIYRDTHITQVINDTEGLHYLQTLLDTEDDPETILQTLEFVGGKDRSQVKVWTAATDGSAWKYTRDNLPNRAAGFYYGNYEFLILGSNNIYNQGRSRGVLINPR